jgi:hypothetical protein
MRSLMTALLVANTVMSAAAQAPVRVVRYGDDRLVGVTEVDIVVRVGQAVADACAASPDSLQSTARDALRQAGLTATVSEKSSSWFYSVVVNVITARVDSRCVASLTTELVAEVQGIPESDLARRPGTWGSLLVGHMPLSSMSELVIVPLSEHDSAVRAAVRGQLTALATKLRAANR